MSKAKRSSRGFAKFFFGLYVGLMLWLLFGRTSRWMPGEPYAQQLLQNINWVPFLTISNYWKVVFQHTNEAAFSHCVINLVGNVFLFILPGWLLPYNWNRFRKFFLFFFTCLSAILLVEALQLVTLLGSCDVDDVILNMLGLLTGYLAYMITHFKKK